MQTNTIESATTPIPDQLADLTRPKAVKFLQRATFGGTPAEVDRLLEIGIDQWFEEQFRASTSTTMLQRFQDTETVWNAYWAGALGDSDQLRKRYTYAMSQIFVSSRASSVHRVAHYNDLLEEHCFGDFRTLLEVISRSPSMSRYLTFHRNKKADGNRGSVPDENYAREIMQLFTIGLHELRQTGLVKTGSNGLPIPTYTNEDIEGLARVFTGFKDEDFGPNDRTADLLPLNSDFARAFHETGVKQFLGTTIPANTNLADSFAIAMDTLTNHSNTGPFVCKQLIQRLTTSNPKRGYVARVARVFEDDGTGRRGNMAAVLRAILLDQSVWRREKEEFGKIREPVLRFTIAARAFNIRSTSGSRWRIADLTDDRTALGQQPWFAPSVFNFYRPGYVPPRTEFGRAEPGESPLVAPEMQIVNETSTIGWVNFMADFLTRQPNVSLDFDDLIEIVRDTENLTEDQIDDLIDELESRLCPPGLSNETRSLMTQALQGSAPSNYRSGNNGVRQQTDMQRVAGAALLVLASTDFIWER